MIPRPYATTITVVQAAVAVTVVAASTVAAITDVISGDALIGLLSAIVGYVLGTASMVVTSDAATERVERGVYSAVSEALVANGNPPPERRGGSR